MTIIAIELLRYWIIEDSGTQGRSQLEGERFQTAMLHVPPVPLLSCEANQDMGPIWTKMETGSGASDVHAVKARLILSLHPIE